jgi:hypothetical protein
LTGEFRAENKKNLGIILTEIRGLAEKSNFAGLAEKTQKFPRDPRP